MEKSNKKRYYHHNNNNKYYASKKKKRLEADEKITYEKLVNTDSEFDEIIDYPKETDDSMIKFVAVSIIVMAIIFGSLLLFHLI